MQALAANCEELGLENRLKWDSAIYCFQMPTVEINILWDGAACCFQISDWFLYYFAALLTDDLLRLPSLYSMIIPLRCLFVHV
jgi:hypothetical protein